MEILNISNMAVVGDQHSHAHMGCDYNKTQVRVLTPEFVQRMAETNAAQRHRRHPWVESLAASHHVVVQAPSRMAPAGKAPTTTALWPSPQV